MFTNIEGSDSDRSTSHEESVPGLAQSVISVKEKVRHWLALPKEQRPTQTTLAKECGVTAQYISKVKLECERERKLERRAKNPLYQMAEMQKHIADGDSIVGENYESVVRKLISMAKDGNIKAAHLLLDSVVNHYRQQPVPVSADRQRTLSPMVAIALSMVPAANGKSAEQIMIEYHGDITPEEEEQIRHRRAEWETRPTIHNQQPTQPVSPSRTSVDADVDNSAKDV